MKKVETVDAQNKVVRLFTYLEKALSLDNTVIRDFRTVTTAPSPWWLADLPTDVENLTLKQFDIGKSTSDEVLVEDNVWLRVEKKALKPAPALPKGLEEWIEEVTPIAEPKAKLKIDRQIKFDHDSKRVDEFKKFRKSYEDGNKIPDLLKDWVILSPDKLPESIESQYEEDQWKSHPELEKLLSGYIKNEWLA